MRVVTLKTLALSVIFAVSSPVYAVVLEGGAVAAPDQYGADVAAQILKKGGNAVDAAVATAFTLAVTYPEAGNIGGGGFMTLFMKGKPYFLDYRETAPKAASRTMYLDEKGDVIPGMSLVGARASGVPGTVMGLWEAHQKFGKLPWAELLTPAIGYAKNGFTVADKQYLYGEAAIKQLEGKTNFGDYFGGMKAGATFRQPELAKTLERIADKGANEFYQGETADLLVAQMQHDNGLITRQDLVDYKAVWRKPLRVNFDGNTLYTAPLPSSRS
jgi:gamma-glutamyltranspeptidase/glutathione hydrolase